MKTFVWNRNIFSFFLILFVSPILFGPPPVHSMDSNSNPLEEGIQWFNQRASGAQNDQAQPEPINKAITKLEQAIDDNPSETAAVYLLRSYYFKGTFVPQSQSEKEDVLAKGKRLGETMIDTFPRSVGIHYGYTANLGRWAEVYGTLSAAQEGVAGTIRNECNRMIELDPTYEHGGPYRILGLVYHDAPYIPFFLTWPSNNEAIKYLEKSLDVAPNDPANNYQYARVLHAKGETDRALDRLNDVLEMEPRTDYLLEDRRTIADARDLKKKIRN